MEQIKRPLSPHLQVYRPQLTSILSITHRATGVALAGGALVLAWWLIALAAGPESYATVHAVLGSVLGQAVLFGFAFAGYYHLCNGIRHLFWDVGMGFELEQAYLSGYAVLGASAALTLLTWIVILAS